jgi:hypothetical protein
MPARQAPQKRLLLPGLLLNPAAEKCRQHPLHKAFRSSVIAVLPE